MIIRYLTQNDISEHDKITSQAFSYACDIHDPESVLPCEKVLGAFDEDNKTLFADMEIHERKCFYDGGVLTCAAVGGVAAKPEHRGKGAVKALFAHLFDRKEYDVSVLYPFAEAYYRKFGYERAGACVCATVPFSGISGIARNSDAVLYEGSGTHELTELYNRCACRYNLALVREDAEAFSDKPYASMLYTYVRKDSAYATVRVDRDSSTVFVREIFFDSCESMLGILGFLRNFESNQQYVCFEKLPADSPVLLYVQDIKRCDIRLQSTGSARILRTEQVLCAHRYPAQGAFSLRVGDEAFRVTVSGTGVSVQRDGADNPDVVMDVTAASKLLLSGITNAAYMPGLTVRNPDSDFFKLFPPVTCFFSDNL